MSKTHSSLAALTLLLLTGAGCFGLGGGTKAPVAAVGGMWVSESAGDTWLSKSVVPTATGSSSISGQDILAIEQDPTDPSTIYIGTKTSGLFYSLDGGESWLRPEDKDASSGSILAIEVDPKNICTYFVLKSDRLLKTTTCGRAFDNAAYVETRTDSGLTALAIDWYNPKTILIGTTEGDVLRSLDGGSTWAALYRADGEVSAIAISNADSRILLVGTTSKSLKRSVDGGGTWTDLKKTLTDFDKSGKVYGFDQTATGSRILMRNGFGLMFSDDNGATWNPISLVTSEAEVTVKAAAISPTNKDLMYYATSNAFYASTSGGKAWSTSNLPSTAAASVMHVDTGKTERVFLGVVLPPKK